MLVKIHSRIFAMMLFRFLKDRRASVAPMFALAVLPVIGLTGAAVDYSRASSVRTAMQSALDATALAMAKLAPSLTSAQLQEKATAYFQATFNRPEAKNLTVTPTYSTSGGSQLIMKANAKMDTAFMKVMGYSSLDIGSTSTIKWGNERLRVALALDNTGSMASAGKMTALKTATKALLTQLKDSATTNGDVYVSIIPFARTVNVGTASINASWIDWDSWEAVNCGGGGSWSWGGWSGWGGWGGWGSGGSSSCSHSSWSGCIADRGGSSGPTGQNYDQNITAPASDAASKFPAWEDDPYCPVAMKGLSYDWTAMNSLVDSMDPAGGTNQPIGLVWAWQSLVGGGPLTAPAKDSNYTYREVIILMSDGLNTVDRWYGTGTSVSTDVDKRMYDASNGGSGTCKNIKDAGITLYTIHVNTDGDPTSQILKNCASDVNKFYTVTSSSGIGTVFNQIGTNLAKLRIAK